MQVSSVACAPSAPQNISANLSTKLAERKRELATRQAFKLSPYVAIPLGISAATLTVWLTITALRNIDAVKKDDRISLTFVELIIMPLATTTIESVIAILHARRREMDWTIQATLVSSIGMTLFVMPVTICAGWGSGLESMTMHFNGFQVAVVFLTVLVITSVFQGPNGRW